MPTGGDLMVDLFIKAGVRHLFGLPGTWTLEFLDALYRSKRMEFYSARHEEVAIGMADGYARITGRPAPVIVHGGSGAGNLARGLMVAYKDCSPVLALICRDMAYKRGRDTWQEVEISEGLGRFAKWATFVERTEDLPRIIRRAFYEATSGRPGPVILEIPLDVMTNELRAMPEGETTRPFQVPLFRPRPDPAEVEEARRMLLEATFPVALAGGGATWSEASKVLRQVVEQLSLPLAVSDSARGIIPEDHESFIGVASRFGYTTTAQALKEADVILVLGCRLDDLTTVHWTSISPKSRLIQVDIMPEEIGRQYPIALGINSDVRAFLEEFLITLEAPPKRLPWKTRLPLIRRRLIQEREDYLRKGEVKGAIGFGRIIKEISPLLSPETVVAGGAGTHTTFASKHIYRLPRTWYCSNGLGSMGFSFPALLGVKVAQPNRPTVALIGDGDFAMTLQDLETAVRYNLGVKVVVFNDYAYGAMKLIQKMRYSGRYIGVDHDNPDFGKVARDFGARGERVAGIRELRPAMERMLKEEGPFVLDVVAKQPPQRLIP